MPRMSYRQRFLFWLLFNTNRIAQRLTLLSPHPTNPESKVVMEPSVGGAAHEGDNKGSGRRWRSPLGNPQRRPASLLKVGIFLSQVGGNIEFVVLLFGAQCFQRSCRARRLYRLPYPG